MMKKTVVFGLVALLLAVFIAPLGAEEKTSKQQAPGWPKEKFFSLGQINGRPIFIDPKGKPFYSKAMVYAYGPERGPLKGKVTAQVVIEELELMKKYGFNTLDLYGNAYLEDILKWCDENEFGIYFRTSHSNKEYPDFMDPNFRNEAKHFYDDFLSAIKGHPSVLAIDMDQRWLFDVSWNGRVRYGYPKLGPESIKYISTWLENKYKKIENLNQLWKKKYNSFSDVLNDTEIVSKGAIVDLDRKPWRIDFVEYVSWIVNDFLKELTDYMRLLDPNHLITYTTELPEVIPFPLSTKENSGIDFISPVHYNVNDDFGRDWIANAELLYMTKFHYDLTGLPVYINETGFRTTFLGAVPENMGYAAAKFNDEVHAAELYLRQTALMNTYPWFLGWGWFKWYDKWSEGDFGYIRDDRSLKPVSKLGQYITSPTAVNFKKDKKPKVWIYYPEYALASTRPSYQQLRTLMLLLENDFLSEYEKMVAELLPNISDPDEQIKKSKIVTSLPDIYNEKWLPFAFTSTIPNDSNPILLAGNSLEQLSFVDRIALANKKTVTFGQIGLTDERYNATTPWFLEVAGISNDSFSQKYDCVPLEKYFNNDGISYKKNTKDGNFDGEGNTYSAELLPDSNKIFTCEKKDATFVFPNKTDKALNNIRCKGQNIDVPDGFYTNIDFLLSSSKGDICRKVSLIYSDATTEEIYFAPAISDWHEKPRFGHTAITADNGYISHISIPVNTAKTLVSIKLPDAEQIHIFALTLKEGGIIKEAQIEVQKDSSISSGLCYWVVSIKQQKDAPYKVLATFKNGDPAIVQSKDGRHIAYLYDALTWDSKEKEISADLKNQAEILESLLNKFKR